MLNGVFSPDMRTPRQVESTGLTAGVVSLRIAVRPNSVIRLINTHATQIAYVNFGDGQETATVLTDIAIPPGGAGVMTAVYLQVPNNCNSMSYIASGASTLVGFAQGA